MSIHLLPKKKKPPRRSSKEHSDAVKDEMMKFKQAGAIKDVFYPEWLASIVVVRKKTGKWRVCGFHGFKQGLSKRSLSYASDRPAGRCYRRPSSDEFFKCLSRIPSNTLALDDQEKTAFVTSTRNYHYKVMPFSLKNAESTYQRMMTKMFEPQLGKNIEVYIDDMVVKSKVVSEHVGDLGNIFEILREHKLHLNASKCSFGVGSGKFLSYMVTHGELKLIPIMLRQ